MQNFYTYMLKCNDNSFYVGHTDGIDKRISEHTTGNGCTYTAQQLPIKVVFIETFPSRDEALIAERQLKGWSRKKKEALILQDWQSIIRLSKSKNNVNDKTRFLEHPSTSSQPSHKASADTAGKKNDNDNKDAA